MQQDASWFDRPTLVRLGLRSPSPLGCQALFLAFRTYHVLKKDYRQQIINALRDDDAGFVHGLALDIAKTVYRDM